MVWVATATALVAVAAAILFDLRYHDHLMSWTAGPADEGAPPGTAWAAAGVLLWAVFLVALVAAAVGWTTWVRSSSRR